MAFELREGQGAAFRNDDKKENPKRPDYRGKLLVGGKEWQLSVWIKEGRSGKFLSLQVQEPRGRYQREPGEDL